MHSQKKVISKNQISFIWSAFKKGKKWAFQEIYKQTYNDLYRFGLKFLNNPDLIKDIIHDLFYKLWLKKDNLSTPTNLKAYLLSSLRSTIINHINQENKQKTEDIKDSFSLESSSEELFINNENQKLNSEILNRELNNLTSKQKEAIYLHYILELDYKEVSTIMGIKIQSARNFVHEGITRLKGARDKFVK